VCIYIVVCVMNVCTYYKIIYKLEIRLSKIRVNLANYSNNKS
jgi:hypothetical protein